MEKLLNQEFFHFGTNKIFIEQWITIQTEQFHKSYIKPYGGLWTSHQNQYSLCDWLDYRFETKSLSLQDCFFISSCLIKFKDTSKIIKINDENDYKNLKDSGFIISLKNPIILNKWYYKSVIDEIINYEKISDNYDLLYVNNNSHRNLRNYSVRTMIALNPDSIEYYRPIDADYINNSILSVGEKKIIEKPDKSFYEFIDYVRTLFKIDYEKDYDLFITKLYTLSLEIIGYLKDNINYLDIKLSEDINKLRMIEAVVKNIYCEQYRKAQKILIKNN